MSLAILRRQTHITAALAPTLSMTDIPPGPSAAAQPPVHDPAPPRWEPGICWHDAHIWYRGHRLGVTVHPDEAVASLLPCPHSNQDGF